MEEGASGRWAWGILVERVTKVSTWSQKRPLGALKCRIPGPPRCSGSTCAPEQDLQVICKHIRFEKHRSGAIRLTLWFRGQCPSLNCSLTVSRRISTEIESVWRLLKPCDNYSNIQSPDPRTTLWPSLVWQNQGNELHLV